jgi:hypothetical protein
MTKEEWLSRESLVEHIYEWFGDYENGWKRTARFFTPIAKDAGVRLRGSLDDIDTAVKEMVEQVRNASTEQVDGYWKHWHKVAGE